MVFGLTILTLYWFVEFGYVVVSTTTCGSTNTLAPFSEDEGVKEELRGV